MRSAQLDVEPSYISYLEVDLVLEAGQEASGNATRLGRGSEDEDRVSCQPP